MQKFLVLGWENPIAGTLNGANRYQQRFAVRAEEQKGQFPQSTQLKRGREQRPPLILTVQFLTISQQIQHFCWLGLPAGQEKCFMDLLYSLMFLFPLLLQGNAHLLFDRTHRSRYPSRMLKQNNAATAWIKLSSCRGGLNKCMQIMHEEHWEMLPSSEAQQPPKEAFSNPCAFLIFENHQVLHWTGYSAAHYQQNIVGWIQEWNIMGADKLDSAQKSTRKLMPRAKSKNIE